MKSFPEILAWILEPYLAEFHGKRERPLRAFNYSPHYIGVPIMPNANETEEDQPDENGVVQKYARDGVGLRV